MKGQKTGGRKKGSKNKIKPPEDVIRKVEAEAVANCIATGESPLTYMLRVMRDPTVAGPRRDEMARAAAPYVHAKISPENTKTTDNYITLAQLVLGSYELQAAEKAKQIEGQVVKPAPAAIEAKALPADNAESEHLPLQRESSPGGDRAQGLNSGQLADRASKHESD